MRQYAFSFPFRCKCRADHKSSHCEQHASAIDCGEMKFGRVRLMHLPAVTKSSHHRGVRHTCGVSSKVKRWIKIGVLLIAVSYALYRLASALPLKQYSADLSTWIQQNQVAGAIVFPLIHWLLIPLCLPASMFELVGGSVFGMFYGIILNTIGKTGGALIAFALGKKIGRDKVGGYLEKNFPAYSAISTILQSDSWKPLFLVQLSSLPHAVKSYGLAVTDVSTYRFTVSSMVTAFPFTILLTHIGYQTQEMLSNSNAGSSGSGTAASASSDTEMVMFIVGIVSTIVTMVFFVVYTKKEIQKQLSKVAAMDKRDDETASIPKRASFAGGDCEQAHGKQSDTVHLLPMMMRSSSSSENLPKHRCSVV